VIASKDKEGELTTGASEGTSSSNAPPADVSPGHMTLAPAKTNLMAPLSTQNFFMMPGSANPTKKSGHLT